MRDVVCFISPDTIPHKWVHGRGIQIIHMMGLTEMARRESPHKMGLISSPI